MSCLENQKTSLFTNSLLNRRVSNDVEHKQLIFNGLNMQNDWCGLLNICMFCLYQHVILKYFGYCVKAAAAVYLITVWSSIQGLHKVCGSLQEDLLQRTTFTIKTS